MRFGIIGSGSWATALAKILTDNGQVIEWAVRSERIVQSLRHRGHNPNYLSSVHFDQNAIHLHTDVKTVVAGCDCLLIAVPSAYALETLRPLAKQDLQNKSILSAIKGI